MARKTKETKDMTEQEFLDLILKLKITTYHYGKDIAWDRKYPKVDNKKTISLKSFLYEKWCTGGVGGGSCWSDGETVHYPIDGEQEPEMDDLDDILLEKCPNIGLLQYKKLIQLVERENWSENEYYGNSTSYASKRITLGALYDGLKKLKLI